MQQTNWTLKIKFSTLFRWPSRFIWFETSRLEELTEPQLRKQIKNKIMSIEPIHVVSLNVIKYTLYRCTNQGTNRYFFIDKINITKWKKNVLRCGCFWGSCWNSCTFDMCIVETSTTSRRLSLAVFHRSKILKKTYKTIWHVLKTWTKRTLNV